MSNLWAELTWWGFCDPVSNKTCPVANLDLALQLAAYLMSLGNCLLYVLLLSYLHHQMWLLLAMVVIILLIIIIVPIALHAKNNSD